jgi:hypothetical protein
MWTISLKSETIRNFKIREDGNFNLFEFKPEVFQNIYLYKGQNKGEENKCILNYSLGC